MFHNKTDSLKTIKFISILTLYLSILKIHNTINGYHNTIWKERLISFPF